MQPIDKKELDLKAAAVLLASATWIFAKSMPKTPHHYTLLKDWESPADFRFILDCIKQYPTPEKFFGRPFNYLIIGEYKYWPMELRGQPVILINRAHIANEYVKK